MSPAPGGLPGRPGAESASPPGPACTGPFRSRCRSAAPVDSAMSSRSAAPRRHAAVRQRSARPCSARSGRLRTSPTRLSRAARATPAPRLRLVEGLVDEPAVAPNTRNAGPTAATRPHRARRRRPAGARCFGIRFGRASGAGNAGLARLAAAQPGQSAGIQARSEELRATRCHSGGSAPGAQARFCGRTRARTAVAVAACPAPHTRRTRIARPPHRLDPLGVLEPATGRRSPGPDLVTYQLPNGL